MIIRSGMPTDARALASFIHSFQPVLTLDPAGTGSEEYLASVSEESETQYMKSSRYQYFVAEDKGKVVGFIALRDNGHVFHMFVDSGRHRQGIARALWNQAREIAHQRGNPGEFTVNSSMIAVPVYQRFGFVPDGEAVIKHGVAFLPMRLKMRDDA